MNLKPRYHEATEFPLPMYFGIGVFQCLSMIPGVSRAGATIVGAMLFGADRRSAAEFSFWLAMPTMVGAFAYEAFKSRARSRAHGNLPAIAVGFVFSFIFGWIVVKTFLRYVQRHCFAAVRLVAHICRHRSASSRSVFSVGGRCGAQLLQLLRCARGSGP